MPVVAVVNRKGGSGKSTLATHVAAYCANQGLPVLLGDTDRNQSSLAWLRMRQHNLPNPGAPIVGRWVDPRSLLRPPAGTQHVVLDTPGGLHGFDLSRLICHADAVMLPVCNSLFDRESASQSWAEIKEHPRVTSGRCKVAAMGMRLDTHTCGAEVLATWAQGLGLPYLGALRDTQTYVSCVESGLTLFDLPPDTVAADMEQWAPILQWLQPVLMPGASAQQQAQRRIFKPNARAEDREQGITLPAGLRLRPPVLVAADAQRGQALAPARLRAAGPAPLRATTSKAPPVLMSVGTADWGDRLGRMFGGLQLRRFFARGS